jgi:hypothetical protein
MTNVTGYGIPRSRMTAKDRVRKHRNNLRAHGCSRLDLWVEADLINDLCTLSKYRHVPLRVIVQEAFKDAVGKYSGVLEVLKRHRGV